jgi:soluble lytic murein transglycosylase-like protein
MRDSIPLFKTARQMPITGQIAAYRQAPVPGRHPTRLASSTAFDALIEKYANLHHVESAIVRAIMATESAFNPNPRSAVGAIGLMQLMPMTARELGVNPLNPEENIEGGAAIRSRSDCALRRDARVRAESAGVCEFPAIGKG